MRLARETAVAGGTLGSAVARRLQPGARDIIGTTGVAGLGAAAATGVALAGPTAAQGVGSDGGTGSDAARIVPTAAIAPTGRNHKPRFMFCLADLTSRSKERR
jgi:hypothetical protein